MQVYRTAIPMRAFEHAAARRDLAEAIVVRLVYPDGREGWGETLPRPYVTGESLESVAADLVNLLWPALAAGAIDWRQNAGLPYQDSAGRCISAAAAALELAELSARPELAAELGPVLPGQAIAARVSGVLGSADPAKTVRKLRLMRWYGLRDFKLKLGFGDQVDRENLRQVHGRLAGAIARGRCTLRVDVNGGWRKEEVPGRAAELAPLGVCVVEQPTFCPAGELVELARRCPLPLLADESLCTWADAQALLAEPAKVWWNLRLSKNGGLRRTLELARLAEASGVTWVHGCMVGESSILSAAQRQGLARVRPRFAEGNFGRFLLADDLCRPSLRFGYGGRLRPLPAGREWAAPRPELLEQWGKLVGQAER